MAHYVTVAGNCMGCGKQIIKPKIMKTPEQLLTDLAFEGGAIVSTNECSEIELADARVSGRFAAWENGIGFVRRTREWLAIQKNREAAHPNTDGIYSANKEVSG